MICQLNSYCVDSRHKTTNHPPPYPPLFSIIHSTPYIFIYCVYFQPTLYHKSCIFAHTICMEFLSNWSSCVGWIKAKDFLTRCYGYVFCCLCDKDEPRYTIYIRIKKNRQTDIHANVLLFDIHDGIYWWWCARRVLLVCQKESECVL